MSSGLSRPAPRAADLAPFDAIHVGAASPHVPPALTEQLAPGGRLLVPVGPEGETQTLTVVDRGADGKLQPPQPAMNVIYVPLCHLEHQLANAR